MPFSQSLHPRKNPSSKHRDLQYQEHQHRSPDQTHEETRNHPLPEIPRAWLLLFMPSSWLLHLVQVEVATCTAVALPVEILGWIAMAF